MRNRHVIVAACAVFWAAGALAQTSQPASQPDAAPASQPSKRTPVSSNPPPHGFDVAGSDKEAMRLADRSLMAMGGKQAWDATRVVRWNFFGRRTHWWDKHTGDARIEWRTGEDDEIKNVIVFNVLTKTGRAWVDGQAVTNETALKERLDQAYSMWVNDGYWLFMPYKLKDPGVTLTLVGEKKTDTGEDASVLQLVFEDAGLTPNNKYHVYISKESHLVVQWDFYAEATDETPRFSTPWADWKRYGRIMLSSDRGEMRGGAIRIEDIEVFNEPTPGLFDGPELPVSMQADS